MWLLATVLLVAFAWSIPAVAPPPASAQPSAGPASPPLTFVATTPILTFHPNGTATTTVQAVQTTGGATSARFELILLPSAIKAVSAPCRLDDPQTVTLSVEQRFDTSLEGATLWLVPAAAAAANPCSNLVTLTSSPPQPLPSISTTLPPDKITLTLRRDTDLALDFFIPLAVGLVFCVAVGGLSLYRIRRIRIDGIPAIQWTALHPIKAGSSWNFKDSIATNVTAAGGVLLAVISAAGATSTLFPGVDLTRFGLLNAVWGGVALIAPLVLGLFDTSGEPRPVRTVVAALEQAVQGARGQFELSQAAGIADEAKEALKAAGQAADDADKSIRAAAEKTRVALVATAAAGKHDERLRAAVDRYRRPAAQAAQAADALAATIPAAAAVLAPAADKSGLPGAVAAGRAASAFLAAAAHAAHSAASALRATAETLDPGGDPQAPYLARDAALAALAAAEALGAAADGLDADGKASTAPAPTSAADRELHQAAHEPGPANHGLSAAAATAATAAVTASAAHHAARALGPVQNRRRWRAGPASRAAYALETATGSASATAGAVALTANGTGPLTTAANEVAADLVAASAAANEAIGAELRSRPQPLPDAAEATQVVAALVRPTSPEASRSSASQDTPGVYANFWLVIAATLITLVGAGAQLATVARMGFLAQTTPLVQTIAAVLLGLLAALVGWYVSQTLSTLVESQADSRGPRTSLNAYPSTAHVV